LDQIGRSTGWTFYWPVRQSSDSTNHLIMEQSSDHGTLAPGIRADQRCRVAPPTANNEAQSAVQLAAQSFAQARF
jgi:hypothetical protein